MVASPAMSRSLAGALLVPALLGSLSGISCVSTPEASGPTVRVRWSELLDGTSDLPDDVQSLVLYVYRLETGERDDASFTLEGLPNVDGDDSPELVQRGLPVGEPIRLVLLGGPSSDDLHYVGTVGPITLDYGERRYVDIRMFSLDTSTTLTSGVPAGRMLHTMTALDDGRVLIAGGFDRATPAAACPTGAPEGANCFSLTGSDDAYIFDPSTGRFWPVTGGLLSARGGQTATLLPDGRVLLAGGAHDAVLVATPSADGMNLSLLVDADDASASTYEIFEPDANAEAEDVDSDGDPGRGGFTGSAGSPTHAGPLDGPRVLHSATGLTDGRVVLAGGVASASSYTVWSSSRAGGYGVVGSGTLPVGRAAPGSALVGTGSSARVLIAGGATATSDDDLADLWNGSGSAPLGTVATAGISTSSGSPQWSLLRPLVETVGDGAGALVVGWYGPSCTGGVPSYAFDETSTLCDFGAGRSFTFDPSTGRATSTSVERGHAFGASTRLDDGTIVIAGGLESLDLSTSSSIEMFGTTVVAGSVPAVATSATLSQRRAFHAMAALPEGGYLVFGGAMLSATGAPTLVSAPEVLFAQRSRGL